jgi:hypothetical protein
MRKIICGLLIAVALVLSYAHSAQDEIAKNYRFCYSIYSIAGKAGHLPLLR